MPDTSHNARIDEAALILTEAVKLAVTFYPVLSPVVPLITSFINMEAHNLKTGLANGTIVPDGQGGFVPVTNSRYDPKTGEFL